MNDVLNCLFSKTPTSPKLRFNGTDNIEWPAPCYKIGEPELVYTYVGITLALPVLLTFFLQRRALVKLVLRLWKNSSSNFSDVGDDPGNEGEEPGIGPVHPATSVMDRVRQLATRKAERTFVYEKVIEASSPQTTLGQIVMLVAVLCSVVSLSIYMKRTFSPPVSLEMCGIGLDEWTVMDILSNIYLIFYFVLRYIGSHKRLMIIYNLHAFGDYFNIPNVVLTCALGRRFTGLINMINSGELHFFSILDGVAAIPTIGRQCHGHFGQSSSGFGFFRIYNFIWLADIAANRSLIRSAVKVRVIRLLILVVAIVVIAAGFLHLVEGLGDPFLDQDDKGYSIYNGQLVPYWRVFLYVYGRVTLLDLSGMTLYTHTGRVIIFVFQLLTVGIIGQAVPAIIVHMKVLPDFDKPFEKPSSYLHIVVSGCVTSSAMKSFLREFYHKDRALSEHFKVLILSEKVPDEEMEFLGERYFNKIEYKRGSLMNLKDLNRIKLSEAAATLILADRTALDTDADDAANIMRVVSVKNLTGSARVIIQVSQYHNKAFLENIPSWSPRNGDTIICIAELQLGLLAQSCHAPGFSTLVANLFTTRSLDAHHECKEQWMADYSRGAALELYYQTFSQAFFGMTFAQACELCYTKLRIVLLAIQDDPDPYESTPKVNAAPDMLVIQGTLGYFLADSKEDVQRARIYCDDCHADVTNPEDITECDCSRNVFLKEIALEHTDSCLRTDQYRSQMSKRGFPHVETLIWSNIQGDDQKHEVKLNFNTGDSSDGPEQGHIEDSTGMFYWCPERSLESVILTRVEAARKPLVNHIVVCILSQKDSQSIGLSNFVYPLRATSLLSEELDDILILCDDRILIEEWGTALNRADLRAAHLSTCKMCVVVGAPGSSEKAGDPTLLDKSVIAATLNVRAMRFSGEEAKQVQKQNPDLNVPIRKTGHEVPLITDLMRESNAQFLDDDDEDSPETEFYLTQPFSGGRAFAATTLDLLMITSFFNPEINRLIQSIIFGEASLELEQVLAEGAGLISGTIPPTKRRKKDHVRVVKIDLAEEQFDERKRLTYGDLFLEALYNDKTLLLGLARKIEGKLEKSVVICSPPQKFELLRSDRALGLKRVGEI